MPTVTIVTSGPGAPNVNPKTIPVPQGNQTITWQINGSSYVFPSTAAAAFAWVTSPPPLGGTLPTLSGGNLVLTYDNTVSATTNWTYNIFIQPAGGGTAISVDPVIQNDPPGDEDDEHPAGRPGPPGHQTGGIGQTGGNQGGGGGGSQQGGQNRDTGNGGD